MWCSFSTSYISGTVFSFVMMWVRVAPWVGLISIVCTSDLPSVFILVSRVWFP
jgi:hypothetical protein